MKLMVPRFKILGSCLFIFSVLRGWKAQAVNSLRRFADVHLKALLRKAADVFFGKQLKLLWPSVPQKANLPNNEVNKTCYEKKGYICLQKKVTAICTLSSCNEKQIKILFL